MFWLWKKFKLLRAVLAARASARQMAAGVACGVLLGMMPKGNLLAVLVAALLLATRMNVATGMLAAFCVSLVAPLCDSVTHRLGEWVLTLPLLVPLWRFGARLPFVAWTSFNNTVVMGSLLLGSGLMYPVYRLSYYGIDRLNRAGKRTRDEAGDAADPAQPSTIALPATSSLSLNASPRRGDVPQRRSCA